MALTQGFNAFPEWGFVRSHLSLRVAILALTVILWFACVAAFAAETSQPPAIADRKPASDLPPQVVLINARIRQVWESSQ